MSDEIQNDEVENEEFGEGLESYDDDSGELGVDRFEEAINNEPDDDAEVSEEGAEDVATTVASPLLQHFKESGNQYADRFNSEEELIQALEQSMPIFDNIDTVNQLVQQGNFYQQHQKEFQEYLESKRTTEGTQPEPEKPAEPATPSFNAPHWDPEWEAHITRDPETDQYIPRNQYSNPAIAEKANKYIVDSRKAMQTLISNPMDYLGPAFEEMIKTKIQPLIDSRFESQSTQSQTQEWYRQQADWMYSKDDKGNFLVDNAGNHIPTPEGQLFGQYYQQAQSLGIHDEMKKAQYALDMTEAYSAKSTPAPAPTNEELKKKSLSGGRKPARRKPGRGGAVASASRKPDEAVDAQAHLDDLFRQKSEEFGITLPSPKG